MMTMGRLGGISELAEELKRIYAEQTEPKHGEWIDCPKQTDCPWK